MIGEQIRAARESAGYTQAELASRAGCSLRAIASLERAENSPTLALLEAVAKGLGKRLLVRLEKK